MDGRVQDSPHPAAASGTPGTTTPLPRLLQRLARWMENQPPFEAVPTIDAGDVDDANDLPRLFIDNARPTVVRDFLRGTPLEGLAFTELRDGPAGAHRLDPAYKPGLVAKSYKGWIESLEPMTLADFLDREVFAPETPRDNLYKPYRNLRIPREFTRALGLVRPPFLAEDEVHPPCIWVGRKGRYTSLHTDPLDNFVLVPIGVKRFHLYSPLHLANLYVQPVGKSLFLRSPVDPRTLREDLYPRAVQARCVSVDVTAGDLLFLPLGWPHFVECGEACFSYNFWLRPSETPYVFRRGSEAAGRGREGAR